MELTKYAFAGAAGAGGLDPKYGGFSLTSPGNTYNHYPRLKDKTSGTVVWAGMTLYAGPSIIQLTDSNGTGTYTLDWTSASTHQQSGGSWPFAQSQYPRTGSHIDSSGNVYVWHYGTHQTNGASDGCWVYKFNGSNGTLTNRVLYSEATNTGYNDPPIRGGFAPTCIQGDPSLGPYIGFTGLTSGGGGWYRHGFLRLNTDLTVNTHHSVGASGEHHADNNQWMAHNPPAGKVGITGGKEYNNSEWMIGQYSYSGTTLSRDWEVKESTLSVKGQVSCYDTSNNLICGGTGALGSWTSNPNSEQNFIAKFNSSGTEQYTIKFSIPNLELEIIGMTADSNDDFIAVYRVLSVVSGSGASNGNVLIKFNGSNGSIAWVKQFSQSSIYRSTCLIHTDSSDDIFMNFSTVLVVIPSDGVGATGPIASWASISNLSTPTTSSAGITWNSYTNRSAHSHGTSALSSNTSFPVTTSNPSFTVSSGLSHTRF